MKLWVIATVCGAMAGVTDGCNYSFPDAGAAGPAGPAGPAESPGSSYAYHPPGGASGGSTPSGSPVHIHEVQPGGHLSGSMGNVQQFSSDEVELLSDGQSVELDAVNPDQHWWVMTLLRFSRPLSDPAWAPGMVRNYVAGVPSADGLSISVTGCSGPSRGAYTFDSQPSQVTIHVLPGATPTGKVLSFVTYWGTSQVVTGTFAFEPG